jgi:hypothetical protein
MSCQVLCSWTRSIRSKDEDIQPVAVCERLTEEAVPSDVDVLQTQMS